MASIQDSKAHFQARASEYGLDDATIRLLETNGITTMSHLAFAISRRGQEVDETKFNTWVTELNGGMPMTMGLTAGLRRLHFESEIILTSVLKASVEEPASESSAPKATPVAERSARLKQMRANLQGVIIESNTEPAYSLVDECMHQFETRILRYIEPSKCYSREAELTNSKNEKKLKVDANTLAIRETKTIPDESVLTAYQLQRCFRRRALAYEFAGLISFMAHERYVEALMRHLTLEPPPNFQQVSLHQVLRADREVFVQISQGIEDIRPTAAGVRPLDAALMTALRSYNVAFHLTPLTKEHSWPSYQKGKGDELTGGYEKGKGKGKGKKGKPGAASAPRGFPGCTGRDNKQRPICFDFNISSCSHAPQGGACQKGRHVCFKIGCHKPHSYATAHADEAKAATS